MLAKGWRVPFASGKSTAAGPKKVIMIASKSSFEPQSSDPLPSSSKVYVSGKMHTDVQVPLREINLTSTKSFNGKTEANAPVRVYDCSGPWGDPAFEGDVEQGLPTLRAKWIQARADVEQ